MKTERNEDNIRKPEFDESEDLLGNSFINYINILSDSIKEYYKISTDIIENKMILFNKIQNELNGSIGDSNQNKFVILLKNLKLNIELSKINLYNFFDDAKILFKKMKDYQNSFKNKIQKIRHLLFKPQNRRRIIKLNTSTHRPSEINYKIKVKPGNSFSFGEKIMTISKERKKPKSSKINRENNFNNFNHSQLIQENEKLKRLNKIYEIDIKKLRLELQRIKKTNSNNIMKINDNTLNNDSVISSLKIKSDEINKKNEQLTKNIKRIQNENKNLKEKNNKLNMFIMSNKYLINKFNNEIQKNNLLKANNDAFNSCKIYLQNDSYYKLNANIDTFDSCKVKLPYKNNNNIYNEHIMTDNLLKNKNDLNEMKLKELEKKNQILKKEKDEIINKYESELFKVINRNKELSKNSINLQKKLVILQRENLDKSKEIEKLEKFNENNEEEEHQKISDFISDKEVK